MHPLVFRRALVRVTGRLCGARFFVPAADVDAHHDLLEDSVTLIPSWRFVGSVAGGVEARPGVGAGAPRAPAVSVRAALLALARRDFQSQ